MSREEIQTVDQAVDWIHSHLKFGMKPGLQRMEWLLERFGRPERRLKFIHIAGTNGKGSTGAYIASVLQTAGYDTGLFISPYTESFRSRIRMNGEDIPEQDLVALVRELKPHVEELAQTDLGEATEFEIVTMLAILYFAKKAYPYFVVWETGLGGRLDATNVVTPIVSVITKVGRDHIHVLGNSLSDIAKEKAGIIKAGVPVISAEQDPEADQVIRAVCKEKKAALYSAGDRFHYRVISRTLENQQFAFTGPFRTIDGLSLSMHGGYQVENASVALMTLEVLRQYYAAVIEDEDLQAGLSKTFWPCRFEIIDSSPRIVLDGAHNVDAMRGLTAALRDYFPEKKCHFVLAILADKESEAMIRELSSLAASFTVVDFETFRPSDSDLEERIERVVQNAVPVKRARNWDDARSMIERDVSAEEIVVVTGSLYFVADVRKAIQNI